MDYLAADRVYHALKETNHVTDHNLLEQLLKSGLNPNSVFLGSHYPDANGKTFLQICCSDGDYAKIKLLIEHGCNVNYATKEVFSPNERRLTYELDRNVQDLTDTCLYYAICNSNEKLVRILVEAGADVGMRCRDKMTALMHAVDSNNLGIVEAISACKNCDVNAQDIYGLSALHIACIHASDEIVEYLLLRRRARVTIEQCQGGTPLFMVNRRRTLGLLMRYGADVKHRAGQGLTALSCVVKKAKDVGCIVDLLDAGCEVPKTLLREIEAKPPTILANNPDVLDSIKRAASRAAPLKLQTASVIRGALLRASEGVGLGVYKRCQLLPLPSLLKRYLTDLGLDPVSTTSE